MTKINPPLGPMIISLIDIAKRNASVCSLLQFCSYYSTMLVKFTDFRRFHRNFARFNPF